MLQMRLRQNLRIPLRKIVHLILRIRKTLTVNQTEKVRLRQLMEIQSDSVADREQIPLF